MGLQRLAHSLVVPAVDPHESPGAHYGGQLASGRYVHPVVRRAGDAILPSMAGQVLNELPAAHHVEELHPAANAQDGHVPLHCCLQQSDFPLILRVGRIVQACAGVRIAVVSRGVDVRAPSDQQAVDGVQGGRDVLR